MNTPFAAHSESFVYAMKQAVAHAKSTCPQHSFKIVCAPSFAEKMAKEIHAMREAGVDVEEEFNPAFSGDTLLAVNGASVQTNDVFGEYDAHVLRECVQLTDAHIAELTEGAAAMRRQIAAMDTARLN